MPKLPGRFRIIFLFLFGLVWYQAVRHEPDRIEGETLKNRSKPQITCFDFLLACAEEVEIQEENDPKGASINNLPTPHPNPFPLPAASNLVLLWPGNNKMVSGLLPTPTGKKILNMFCVFQV
jgi:hypothetical protein